MADSPLAHSPTLAAHAGEPGAQLAAGQTVGEYVIDQFIGAGAMGEVYAAHHPVIGKKVAIKVLRNASASAETAERFTREARAANQIDHPNVIDVFGFGRTDDGRLYLVMALVEGCTLREEVQRGALELPRALDILDAIAGALDAAHARGVIHRDLKPDNIMLSRDPLRVFVLDFGLAKLAAAATDSSAAPGTLTGQGTWLGTPGYMAPEQWSVDGACPSSDLYALGVIAFELLAGAPPFQAKSVPAMMEQHFRAAVPALSSRGNAALPSALDAVLQRALAKDPDERFASARELVDALRAAGGGSVRVRGRARRPWLPAAAGAGVLGVGVLTVFALRGGSNDTPKPSSDPPRGDVAELAIATRPEGAAVFADGKPAGTSPTTISPRRGASVELVARLPGYRSAQRTLVAGETARVELELDPVLRFQGVWRLGNGELRAFERHDERVDASKLDAVDGPRHFYRHYAFAPAETGIAFGGDEEIVDPRAPDEASCHVPVHVEYRYDAERDTLVLARDVAHLDLRDGKCVIIDRKPVTEPLVRVDGVRDTLEIPAPAGKAPPAPPAKRTRATAKQQIQRAVQNAGKQANKVLPLVPKQPPPSLPPTRTATDNTAQPARNDSQQAANPPPVQQAPDQVAPQQMQKK